MYERGVQFRLGRVEDGAHGPGVIFIVPLVAPQDLRNSLARKHGLSRVASRQKQRYPRGRAEW
jgi:regulator of protease activity HflC (stomatin/prohibitin superfamily)